MHIFILFLIILTTLHISKVHGIKFRNIKFEQNCSHISGEGKYLLQSVAILFNCTEDVILHAVSPAEGYQVLLRPILSYFSVRHSN